MNWIGSQKQDSHYIFPHLVIGWTNLESLRNMAVKALLYTIFISFIYFITLLHRAAASSLVYWISMQWINSVDVVLGLKLHVHAAYTILLR